MEMISITPIYVAVIALWMVYLAVRVAKGRGKYNVSLGDGGHDDLNVRVRGFGNLTEYAPIVLLLLLMMELKGIEALWLHIYGSIFVVLRIIHPLALYGQVKPTPLRKMGRIVSAVGTATLMAVAGIALLLM